MPTLDLSNLNAAMTAELRFDRETWMKVLKSFRYLGVATSDQVATITGMSLTTVTRVLQALMNIAAPLNEGEPAEVVITKGDRRIFRAWSKTSSTPYFLGRAGRALLREEGCQESYRVPDPETANAVEAMQLMEVVSALESRGVRCEAERTLGARPAQTIVVDVVCLQDDLGWAVEVENMASEANTDRRVRKVENWINYFRNNPAPTVKGRGNSEETAAPLSTDVLVLFNTANLDDARTSATLWAQALWLADIRDGQHMPFRMRWMFLKDWLAKPIIRPEAFVGLPIITPVAAIQAPTGVSRGNPFDEPDEPNARVSDFILRCYDLWTRSRGGEKEWPVVMGIPKGMVNGMRTWLLGELDPVRPMLKQAITRARKVAVQQVPGILAPAFWRVLEQYGIYENRIGGLIKNQNPPLRMGVAVDDGLARVIVAISDDLWRAYPELGQAIPGGTIAAATAVEEVLTAFFRYGDRMELIDAADGRRGARSRRDDADEMPSPPVGM